VVRPYPGVPEDTTVSRPPRHAIDPGARWPRWIRDVVPAVQRYVEDRLSDPSAGVAAATRASLRELQKPFERRGETSPTGCVSGGARPDRAGFVVQPTVFADADDDMTIAREEISGPVGTVIPSDDPEGAVRIANTTTYGPAATIWTKDVTAAHSLPAQARAAAVWVDCWAAIDAALP
jgi:acyl-CoA reductase-like NAD-dependent aldehyde dehydrogenase